VTEQWKWASYKRVKEAAEELKRLIRAQYPDAEFKLVRAENSRRAWHLLTMTDDDQFDEISALVVDREVDLLAEEHVPIYVIPRVRGSVPVGTKPAPMRKAG
jgi:hypothetical protein